MVRYSLTEMLKDAVSLADATKLFPMRPPVAQVNRWSTNGVRGVRLQTWLCGGKRVTTPAAVEAFLRELNAETLAASAASGDGDQRAKQAGAALDALLTSPKKSVRRPK